MDRLSLIISVYEAVSYTEMVLASVARQNFRNYEVLIGDDGSSPAMQEMVDRFRKKNIFPIKYLWQPDEGFRKTKMLNNAVKAGSGDYLVFVDGDCLLHQDFLEDHWENREEGVVLCGRRVNFGEKLSRRLTMKEIENGEYEKINWNTLKQALKGEIRFLEKGCRLPNGIFQWVVQREKTSILGSNFSLFRKDILSVNGFNEDYTEPGFGEDCDLEFRLKLKGFLFRRLKNLAVQYHLFHAQSPAGKKSLEIYKSAVAKKEPFCKNGIVKG